MPPTIRVLIVDDSALVRKLLRDVISKDADMEVVGTASNGLEAISAIKELKPDVVTMDINMPEMDGLTAVKNILGVDPDAKIVICSALGERQLMLEALEEGVRDFITKPFQPDKVIEVVRKLLA